MKLGARIFRNNENCVAGYYKKKKSHEHGLQKIYTRLQLPKKKKKKSYAFFKIFSFLEMSELMHYSRKIVNYICAAGAALL